MDFEISTAVLHALDTTADEPLYSAAPMALNDDILGFLENQLSKAFSNDETKGCTLSEESDFAPLLWNIEDNFVSKSSTLAREWFAVLRENASVPCGDVVFAVASAGSAEWLCAIKLNYRAGYIHYFDKEDDKTRNDIVRQTCVLGSKAEEGYFVNLTTREVRVLEKKYDIDGKKQTYISSRLLGCKTGMSPKEKLTAIQCVAEEVNQRFYGNTGVDETQLAAAVCEEYHARESADDDIPVREICTKLYGDMPHAREAFTNALAERDITLDEPLQLSAPAVRRLEKQSLRSGSGVEIKVPVSLYKDENAVQFIKNPDGTTLLLIKNVLI